MYTRRKHLSFRRSVLLEHLHSGRRNGFASSKRFSRPVASGRDVRSRALRRARPLRHAAALAPPQSHHHSRCRSGFRFAPESREPRQHAMAASQLLEDPFDDGEAVVSIVALSKSTGAERVIASTALERDPARQTETLRNSNAAVRAGRRVRLRIVGDSPTLEWSLTENVSLDENETFCVRFRANTLVLEAPLSHTSFPTTCHSGDPPVEKVVGSLRVRGAVAQLRFAPRGETQTAFADDKTEPHATNATSFRLLDGAITFGDACALGRVASLRSGALALPLARDVYEQTVRTPAPRAGRSPDVWDPVNDAEDAEDGSVAAARLQRRNEMMSDTVSWRGTETACGPLLARREARILDLAAVDIRRDCVLEMARRLRQVHFDAAEVADKAEAFQSADADASRRKAFGPFLVTESLIASVRQGLTMIKKTNNGKHRGGETPRTLEEIRKRNDDEQKNVETALDGLDDLDGFDVSGLATELTELSTRREVLIQQVRALETDVADRHQWDTHESGVETRDVLENGVRRFDMEKTLGRPATKLDVDASLRIPAKERMRIVAGVDVEKARITGRPEYVKKLGGGSFFG
jgi:hypothetical protein